MLNGEFYTDDYELISNRNKARKLTTKYNTSTPTELTLRNNILKKLFKSLGKNAYIEPPFICDYGSQIEWGENSYANFNCVILDSASVKIGNNVMLGPNVNIYTATHSIYPSLRNDIQKEGLESLITYAKPVVIEDGVWIGGSSIILLGIKIGANSVIGAGSVVTKDIPANVVSVGNPCKVIKSINEKHVVIK
ncbi:maltose O-acetyltransferase [Bacillus thuringiensis serovar brasilensis]|uniref:sugar O-acetyltransferase n=1 Tax=Bacillus cereus group TaxID=86661 RepID=UPI000A3B9D37|nr:sugar O-acetyltransferase [Bacillus thuringiensis]MCU5032203.1 sugar O-acetyltransferase [Bacillus cereus]MRA75316.1 maltose O-acetyltransferase [Bacillus thuringiensis]MRA93805.1 maltose O-acetyltransferase [Bacillus thuringiensis]MRC56527.1 maltose O-acetyltransferase [Bacillus thuringiensis]OTX35830.1 maltose O-acetyltransferase [Bacillus thuringiensis serovar brasilensis]